MCYSHVAVNYLSSSLPVGVRSIAISVSVCLSACQCVCLFICPLAYIKTYIPNVTKCALHISMAVDRSSSDGSAIRYVLPVLWMTSRFHSMVLSGQNQRRRVCFIWFAGWLLFYSKCLHLSRLSSVIQRSVRWALSVV